MDNINPFLTQLSGVIQNKINSVHTAIPAKVLEYDSKTNNAKVLPLTRMVLGDGTVIDYPPISFVPFVFPRSANVEIAFPIKAGDTCLLIFCENALDRWRGRGELDSQLKFSLTNAVAIPGLFAEPSALLEEAVNDNAVILKSGTNKVKVSPLGIDITGNVTISGDLTVSGDINSGSVTTGSINTGSCNLHTD